MVYKKVTEYWYPWSPTAFRRDTYGLNDIQELIYRRLIDFYMEVNKGPLEDNDQALANIARVSLDVWKKNCAPIRAMAKKGKKQKGRGGTDTLIFQRCEVVLAEQNRRREILSKNGIKGGYEKVKNNKGLLATARKNSGTDTDKATNTLHLSSKEDSSVSSSAVKSQNDQIADKAFELYNQSAARAGIPLAQRLNPTRKTRILARVREAGGLEGWMIALEKLEKSDFLCGRAGKDFKASIDFILQELSFTKLMEGNYDNGPSTSSTKQSPDNRRVEGFGRAADKHARKRGEGMAHGAPAKNNLFD